MSLTQEQKDILNRMAQEVNDSPRVFRASRLWQMFCRWALAQLQEHGLENFKRTITQHYFNWLPATSHDRQYKRLLRFYKENPPPAPLSIVISPVDLFHELIGENYFEDEVKRDFYGNLIGLLWYYTLKTDQYGILSSLSEPQIGNPIRIIFGGKLISQDLANSVRERNVLVDHMSDATARRRSDRPTLVVADLGAGSGRVAYVLGRTTSCRCLIFDLPPALFVAQWYLGQLFPDRRHMTFRRFEKFEEVADELESADFAFFTPNQLALFPPKYIDAFYSISSLAEMLPNQVENYLRLMAHTTRRIIYLKQWAKWRNPADRIIMRKDAYRIPGWDLILERRDSVQVRFVEMVYRAKDFAATADRSAGLTADRLPGLAAKSVPGASAVRASSRIHDT